MRLSFIRVVLVATALFLGGYLLAFQNNLKEVVNAIQHIQSPQEVKSLLAGEQLEAFIKQTYSNDTIKISILVSRTSASTQFSLGNANFPIRLDTAIFEVSKAQITKRAAWDAFYNPLQYAPMVLGYNNAAQVLSLNVEQRAGTGNIWVPQTDSLLAEITIPMKKCVDDFRIVWNRTAPRGQILTYTGTSILDDAVFFDSDAFDACPCIADFTGLGSNYCTSSFLSKLVPTNEGGVFKGPGVNFASGIWYFKAFDAGAGTHKISYILPCGDTITKTVNVESAPCQSLGSQDITGGFAFVTQPRGIFTDCNGEIYATSQLDHTVYKIDSFGVKSVLAGVEGISGYTDGATNIAQFDFPTGVVKSSVTGNVYVVDGRNQVIREINTSTNTVSTIAGAFDSDYGTADDDGVGASAKFSTQGVGITLNRTQDTLYITESSAGISSGKGGQIHQWIFRIRQLSLITKEVKTVAGGSYASNVLSGNDIDAPTGTNARFRGLGHLSADERFLYVADQVGRKIRKISLTAPYAVSTIVGGGSFSRPISASVASNGVIYSADQFDCTLKEITQFPSVSVNIAAGVSGDCSDTETTFNSPNATSVFVKGFIDVADFGSGKIKRVGIKDYGSLPFRGASKNYCFNGVKDTLNYILGTYTGNGVSKQNNIWIFDPVAAGIGKHIVKYSYNLNTCDAIFTDTFIVHPRPKPLNGLNKSICTNELGAFQLDAGAGNSYQWFRGLPNQSIVGANRRFFTVGTPGVYSVRITDTLGCVGGDTISVTTLPTSSISLGPDKSLCAGFTTELSFTPNSGITSVLWQDSTSGLTNTAHGGGVYFVTAKDINGCTVSDTLNIISSLPPTPLISSVPAERCSSFVKTTANFPADNTFLTPQLQSMVMDTNGNTFITDFENNVIRKIDIFGNKTIYAGQAGILGDTNGLDITTVRLRRPYGITIDRNQNIYVTEVSPNIIRKITPTGKVSIYAGVSGSTGTNGDGRKDTIFLWQPTAIDIDDQGNLYVAEFERHIVRKISPLGFTETIGLANNSGDAVGTYAQTRFNRPQALTVDKAGFVYVADRTGTIKKINPITKRVSRYSSLPSAVTSDIRGITIDNLRRMYVSLNTNYLLYYIDPRDSSAVYYAGVNNSSGTNDGVMTTARFSNLQGLYVNENGGPLYVVDKNNIRIVTDSCGVTICEGYTATLTANPHTSYEWNNNSTQNTRSISVGTAGKYFVRVSNNVGCTFFDTITVSVIPRPSLIVTKDTTICFDDSTTIVANISPFTSQDTITWLRDNVIVNRTIGLASNSVKVPVGTYVAELRTGKQCVYSRSMNVIGLQPQLRLLATPDTICQGQSASLQVTVFNAIPPLSYQWLGDVVNLPNSSNTTVAPINAGNNKYKVNVTDSKGCFNSDSINVFVKPRPRIVAIPDTNICLGNTINLTTTISGGKLPYRSQFWTPSSGLSDPLSLNPSITPNDSVVYIINVTDADACTSRDTIRVGVIKLNVSAATTDSDTICPSSSANLNVNVSGGSGNYLYQWSPANGLSATNIKNPIASPAVSTDYTVRVSDARFGCEANRSVRVSAVNLTVELGSDISTCINNNPIQLNANVVGGKRPYQYFWTPTSGLSNISIPNPIVNNTQTRNTKYLLTVSDASGCEVKDSIEVRIDERPTIELPSDTSVCSGASISLSASIKPQSNQASVVWTNNLNAQLLNGATISIQPNQAIKYYAQATLSNGCTTNIDSINVSPVVIDLNLSSDKNNICVGDSISLITSVQGGRAPYQYLWSPSNLTGGNPKIKPNSTSTVKLLVTDLLGCTANDSLQLIVSSLNVNAGIDKLLCSGFTHQLGASISGGVANYNIIWSPSANLNLTNVLNPTFSGTQLGNYEYIISISDAAGCTSKDTLEIEVLDKPIINLANDTLASCANTILQIAQPPLASGGAGAPYLYNWESTNNLFRFSDNQIENPTININSFSGYISVEVADAIGCSSKDSMYIQSNPLPKLETESSSDKFCLPNLETIRVKAEEAFTVYQWKDVLQNTVLSNTSSLEIPKSGTYQLRATNTQTSCKDSATVTVNYSEKPKELFITSDNNQCINAPIRLVGAAIGTGLIYQWSTTNGQGIISPTNTVNSIYIPNELLDPISPNKIDIKLKVENICGADSILLPIELKPSVKPSFKTDVKDLLPGNIARFLNITDTINKGSVTFQWQFGDGQRANTFDASHIYNNAGVYDVILISQNRFNCTDTASLPITVLGSQILYIPNAFAPMSSNFENKTAKIYGATLSPDGFEWNIYNRWGEVIYSTKNTEDATTKGWSGKFNNSGEELPLGAYTYTLKAKLADGKEIEKTGTITLIR